MTSIYTLISTFIFIFIGRYENHSHAMYKQYGVLTVIVSGFRNNNGQAGITLFNREGDFPKYPERGVKSMYLSISQNQTIVRYENLPAGEYAVSVYHDENDNKKMDTNFFGIPKEGVGASNDARGHLGPPKYKDAKFRFDGNKQTITIRIVYL